MVKQFSDEDEAPQPREVDAPPPAPTPAAPVAPPAVVKAVEVWAAAKGLYPQFFAPPPVTISAPLQAGGVMALPMGQLQAPRHNPEFWKFAAAAAYHGWAIGAELTEAAFDAAVHTAINATSV